MTFADILEQILAMLQRHGRVSYRALKRQFRLDDDYLADLKHEIIDVHRVAVDHDGIMLVLTGQTSLPSPAAQPDVILEAERRQLTVMFCDMVGSTPLSLQLDPEDFREVILAYQQTATAVIQHYDGHLAQYMGDGILAYFGWPQAHENDAVRAVQAGLSILAAMDTLNVRLAQDKGIRQAIRIGIHTGLVVVSDMWGGGHQGQLALGGAPNIAARFQGLAAPGTLVVSGATFRLVEGYFEVEDQGYHPLKGIATPMQVYRVLRESAIQSRLDMPTRQGLTPLVGREREVAQLVALWQDVKTGQGQVVLVSGEPGIGKSRLVKTLKDHMTSESHTRIECRSSPYYQHTALYPFIDLFQRVIHWHSDDSPEDRLQRLEVELSQYSRPLLETVPLFASLLSLRLPEQRYPQMGLSAQRQRRKTLEVILALLLERAAQRPVFLIVEDLHWADPYTLELLDLLIDQASQARIFIILTFRPTFQPPWSSRAYLTRLTLHSLSRSQIERIVALTADDKTLPPEVVQQIADKTDGVPLFIEEMTKAVLESGLLREKDGHYELVGPLSSLLVPATLHDSLMARLDRLMTAKGVAQLAAVIGRQFSFALLRAVSHLEEETLQQELQRLVHAQLIDQRGSPAQVTYIFKHALVTDIAYQSLLKSTRQEYHQRIAEVLEAHFPETAEEHPELLAHHYSEAGGAAKAVAYWQQAARRLVQRSAHVEAILHLHKGLALLSGLPETPQRMQQELALQTMLGPALMSVKGYAAWDVEHAYKRAWELCQQLQDTPRMIQVLLGLGMCYSTRADLRAALEIGEQGLCLAQREGDPVRLLQTHLALGSALSLSGKPASAYEHLAKGIALDDPRHYRSRRAPGVTNPRVACRCYAAFALWQLGYPDQARQQSEEALRLAQALDHPITLATALTWTAFVHQYFREVQVVRERAEAAVALSMEQGFAYFAAQAMIMLGWGLVLQGQHTEGITQMQQGMENHRATESVVGESYFLALLAEAHGIRGTPQIGLRVVTKALAYVGRSGEGWWEAELYRLKGALLLLQSANYSAAAETCFQQALEVARRQQARSFELRAVMSLGQLWHEQGKTAAARNLLTPIYTWFTEGLTTMDLRAAKTLLTALET